MDHATPSLALNGKKNLRLEEHAAWHTLVKKKGAKKEKEQAGIVAAGEERRQPLLANGYSLHLAPTRRLCCAT